VLGKSVKKISIVIPVYSNNDSLMELVDNLELERVKNEGYEFEYIFVDDGSSDGSLALLKEIKNDQGSRMKIIQLSRNFGQVAALKAGYSFSTGDLIITISADLQDPTDLISKMIEKSKLGFDIVICNRSKRSDGLIARVTSSIGYKVLRNRVSSIPNGGFDVFLIIAEAKNHLLKLHGRFSFLQGDVLNLGYNITFISYHRASRPFGRSGYTFGKRFQYFTDALIDTSYKTIKTLIKFGFFISLVGFMFAAFVIYGKFVGSSPFSGFAIITSAILIVGGTQIILTGLLGEYVWRIYDMNRNKPMYIVKKIFDE
jgi:glycosyltransferase involved in cell wall biosynthesis